MPCIYKITNLVNDKFYIGSTQHSFKKRKGEHLAELNGGYHKNKHLQSSYIKYGKENFVFEIVEEFVFLQDYSRDYIYEYITDREMFYITGLNPEYNIARETRGGRLGRIPSIEEREHLRKLFTGREVSEEAKQKIRIARAKQIITEEHKRKIGLVHKGNKHCLGHKQSDEQKQKTREQVLLNNSLGIGMHSVEAKEKRTESLKIKFNTPEMKEKLKFQARNRNTRPFICFDKNNTFIGEFLSTANTADLLNLKSSEVCAVLRQEQNTTKGYKFIFKEDYNGKLF